VLPDIRMPSPLISLVRLRSSSFNRQPSNRPTLTICLDTNTRTARPELQFTLRCVQLHRQPARRLSHASVGICEAGWGLPQSSVDGSYCNMKPASI